MIQYVIAVLVVLAVLAWLSAAAHAAVLLPHREGDHSLARLALQGHRWFSRDTWRPSGHAIHRRFVRSALAFGALLVLLLVVSAIAATTAR